MQRRNKIIIVTVVVALAVILAGGVLLYLNNGKISESTADSEKRETLRLGDIKKEEPREESTVIRELSPPATEAAPVRPEQAENEYQYYLEQVKNFCSYLDGREYVKKYEITEGTYLRMLAIIAKLSRLKPVIVAETQDMARLASNLYYFYRVMGKKDTLLVADMLVHEREKMEAVFALFHAWLIMDRKQPLPNTETSIEALYNYGAFFLNTLGGKSYLARRDSKVSFLVRYYSLLMVDRADGMTKNPYGIDVLPHLEMLITDMALMGDLEYRATYETTLKDIRSRMVRR